MKKSTLPTALLAVSLLSGPALAWVPALDESSAKTVIDGAYNRSATPVNTLLSLDLSVKDGQFAAGDGAVKAFDGGDACVSDWKQNPTDYAKFGSRPTNVTLTGQADELFLQAQQARDQFKNLTVKDALAPSDTRLPAGNLRVYVQMQGLGDQKLRDAYNVAIRTADGKIVQPLKRAFTSDWKQGEGGLWGGTMVYYFDAAGAGVKPNGKLDVLLRTEADSNCAYQVQADLSKFY